MRNLYVTTISLLIGATSFAQWGEIENGGFENWTIVNLYDTPTDWISSNSQEFSGVPTVFKSLDAQDGTFSCEIKVVEQGQDTIFGYVFHGSVGDMGPDGGIAYATVFDEIRFKYKSDLKTNDSLFLIAIRFISGIPVENIIESCAFGTNSTWMNGSVSVSTNPQEELFIGFVVGDPFSDAKPDPASWVRIDNVEMYASGVPVADVPNPSFETWNAVSFEEPNDWYTMNALLSGQGLENAIKTTDSNSGSYAVELSTVQTAMGDTMRGFLSKGFIDWNDWMNPFKPVPYNAIPSTFSGSYKYSPVNSDAASINLTFFQGGIPIGNVNQNFNVAQANYSNFSSPISLSGTPDSMVLYMYSGDNPGTVLTIDNLSLSGGDVNVAELTSNDFVVYPNPTTNVVYINCPSGLAYSYELIDLNGKAILSDFDLNGMIEIQVNNVQAGTYILKLNDGSMVKTEKLIIR